MEKALWHALPVEKTAEELAADLSRGLASKEAAKRLEEYGANEITAGRGRTALSIFLGQFRSALVIILLIATLLSAAAGETVDAVLIVAIVFLSAGLGFMQEHRAERAIAALRQYLAPLARVIRDGSEVVVSAKDLVPGDLIQVEAGDRTPADARVALSRSLMLDEAPLTGESAPVAKDPAPVPPDAAVADRSDMLFAGTTVTYGRGQAIVTATGMQTELGIIAREAEAVRAGSTPLEKTTREIGRWLGAIALTASVLIGGIGLLREWHSGALTLKFALDMAVFAAALAVAAVPESLAAIVTGTLAIGMHEMAKKNALVRRMPAVETLGSVTVICSDKTGTITKGEMTVRSIYSAGKFIEVTGTGYDPEGSFSVDKPGARLADLFAAAILCNDSSLFKTAEGWRIRGDPTEAALLAAARKAGADVESTRAYGRRVNEFPFSSERKMMTTLNEADGKLIAFSKGAPGRGLARCGFELRNKVPVPIDDKRKEEISLAAAQMASKGLRVLAAARKETDNPQDEPAGSMVFLGLFGMTDPPRPEAVEAVDVCKRMGIRPVMITGDNLLTARAVAAEAGIFREGDGALTGAEMEKITDEELAGKVESTTVYARVSPLDKLRIVRAWKARGQIVAMTGDGVNDAPALKQADIGIAMGKSGTEAAREAADMVLADDNFATIVGAIERGRWIYDNIKKYLTYLLRTNLLEIIVLGGVAIIRGPRLLPLLPPAILFVNLITDGLPAFSLGVAPPEADLMKRKPRPPGASIFSPDVRALILLSLSIEAPVIFWFFFSAAGLAEARTTVFFLLLIVELAMALNFRSLRQSIFREPPHRWLSISVLASLAITAAAVSFPPVRDAFGIDIPRSGDIGWALAVSALATCSVEITKSWIRRRSKPQVIE